MNETARALGTGSRLATDEVAVSPIIDLALEIGERYTSFHNITYATASNFGIKLDVYQPKADSGGRRPALLYFHGGGWMGDFTKESRLLQLLPFLQLGWVVVNADYRPLSVSLAPAAVEDGLCALRWVARNAREHNIDIDQLVLMGHSAGGHIALTTGMIPFSGAGLGAPSQYLDIYDPTTRRRKLDVPVMPAAIVNWFGITDVLDLIEGPHQQPYAVAWLGNQSDRVAVAKAVSPLSYVRPELPPILTVHGVRDTCVPYDHAVRLHSALTAVQVPNKLIPVADAEHGQFGLEVLRSVYVQLFDFLHSVGVTVCVA